MATIKVDSAIIREKASVFTNVAGAIQRLTGDMNKTIEGLKTSWTGTAAETLVENYKKLQANFDEKYTTINNYASFLNQAAEAYDRVEDASAQSAGGGANGTR